MLFASGNLAFIARAKEAKKADLELNDLIQAKAYKELSYVNHPELDKISDNFINSIVDQKVIINTPPPYEVAEALAKENNLKTWYLVFSVVFLLGSGILGYQFYGEASFLWLELLAVLSVINLIGCLYFNFLYKKRTTI